jgi:hypothetical protein
VLVPEALSGIPAFVNALAMSRPAEWGAPQVVAQVLLRGPANNEPNPPLLRAASLTIQRSCVACCSLIDNAAPLAAFPHACSLLAPQP